MNNKYNINEIIPRLYIGDYHSALSPSFMKEYNIKAVLNLTNDIPNRFKNKDIHYQQIYVEDSLKDKDLNIMYTNLPFIVEYIHTHRDKYKHNIYVHCHQGIQRSACAILCYLLKYHPYIAKTIDDGKKFMVKKRPIVFHNGQCINFESSIKKYIKNFVKSNKKTKTIKNVVKSK
jgi:protein-tyrosine phosphatase